MKRLIRTTARLLAYMLATMLAPVSSVHAADAPTTIIVFDGSGSMWGRVSGDRDTKFGVARDALRLVLPKLAPATRIGLAAFGHRRKGDCSDTEVMLAPEPIDAARLLGPLEKLNPRGKGPLVAAVREAAAALAKVNGPASLVLLHDDPDNCAQDPCAAAEDLVKSNPGLAVHVISIGLSAADARRMACLPQTTGGRHFEPQDATQLATAIDEAMRLASLGPKPAAPVASAPAPQAAKPPAAAAPAVAPPPVDDNGPPAMRLIATLGPNGPAVIVPLAWKVTRSDAAPGTPPVLVTRAPSIDQPVAAGSYVVEIQHGLVSARETIEVKPKGATRHTLVLQAGAVRMSAMLQRATTALDQAVFVITDVPSAGVPAKTVWTGGADAPPVFLPVGSWKISAEIDRAHAERMVTVSAGSMIDVPFILGAGKLRARATDREGGAALDRVVFRVTEDDADSPDGRREVARSTAPECEFTLPAGTYYLTARYGQAEIRERVLVNAGDDVSRTLLIPLGRLGLQSRIAGSNAVLDTGVAYTIERIDGTQEPIQSRSGTPRIELPAGQYRVTSQLGGQNARIVRDVEIRGGAQTNLNFDHVAANIQLRFAGSAGRAMPGETMWDVRDAQGRSVWQTVQSEPRAFLAAGRYTVLAESRDRRGRVAIDVKGGEARTIDVPLE